MDKYLLEIIKDKGSIIIPGIGALMMSSSGDKIIFNPHLKFNNGALESYLAKSEGISDQDASNKVAKYVREMEQILDKGEVYSMFGLGELKKTDNNIAFTHKPDVATSSTSATEDKPAVAKTPEVKPEEKKPEAKSTPPKKETPAPEPKKEDTKKASTPASAAKEKPLTPLEKKIEEKKAAAQEKKAPAKNPKSSKTPKNGNKAVKAKKSPLPLIILAVVVVGLGGFGYWKQDMIKSWFEAPKPTEVVIQETDVVVEEVVDSAAVDSASIAVEEVHPEEEVDNTPKVKEVSVPAAQVAGNYSIVLGCFSVPENATGYIQSISNSNVSRYDGKMTWVLYGKYSSQQEANSALSEAKQINPDAWVKKF